MKKITYIISEINKAPAFEWIHQSLSEAGFLLSYILINNESTVFEEYCKAHNAEVYNIRFRNKAGIFAAVFTCTKLLKKIKPDIVHCHLLSAGLTGLPAAYFAGIQKRIYTRHYSDYHLKYFPKGVYYDKLMNWLASDIVAVSGVVEKLLLEREGVPVHKVRVIEHGFDLSYFCNASSELSKELFRKYNFYGKKPVIGVISRYTEYKGIQYIIPAFKKILEEYPDALLLLANSKGDYVMKIKTALKSLPENSFVEVEYEKNISGLYRLMDVFIHTPVDEQAEAFGQVYIEALAAGVPSVFTLSGVAPQFIVNEKNALVVDYRNSEQIFHAVIRILKEQPLRDRLIKEGTQSVKTFDVESMIDKHLALYEK